MATTNAVAKTWHNNTGVGDILPSFDGFKYTKYRDGEKPSGFVTTPTIIDMDFNAGPLTGGPTGNGPPITIFGYNLGLSTTLGQQGGTFVSFRDTAGDNTWYTVAAYNSLGPSLTFNANQVEALSFYPGSLGGSQTNGHTLDVKVTNAGVDSNILSSFYTIQPGDFYYVNNSTGIDATGVKNDITKPFRYFQFWTGTTFTGVCGSGHLQPGDWIIPTTGGPWTDQTGFDGRLFRFAQTGSWATGVGGGNAPTGVAGHGYINFAVLPGQTFAGVFTPGGGIQGCQGTFAFNGFGKYVAISGISSQIQGGAGRDAAPINGQDGADHWRVYHCNCGPWVAGSSTVLNAAGIVGQFSNAKIKFNVCHDIQGLSDLQNHGIYMGGTTDGGLDQATTNTEISYNWVYNCTGGSGIQWFWANSAATMTGNSCHHNYVDTVQKYGINLGDSTVSIDCYNNIIINCGLNLFRIAPPAGQTPAVNVCMNTGYGFNRTGGVVNTAAILQEGTVTSGFVKIRHNIITQSAAISASVVRYFNNGGGDSNVTADQNVWWNFHTGAALTGGITDADAITSDPLFTSLTSSPINLTLSSGSPALDAVTTTEAISVTTDFYGVTRPQGAHKDVGATEGIGT